MGKQLSVWTFSRVYEELSATGACDSPFGGEYHRVLEEWLEAGRPKELRAFIRVVANVGKFPRLAYESGEFSEDEWSRGLEATAASLGVPTSKVRRWAERGLEADAAAAPVPHG